MEKLTNNEFITPTILLASVYSGLIYNLLLMVNKSVLDGTWSIFTNVRSLSNILAIVFIVFTVILIFSIKYIDRIYQKALITTVILLVGLSCLVVAGFWTLEWFILGFVVVGLAIAYLTPNLYKLSSELVGPDPEKEYYIKIYPISLILWIGISAVLFILIDEELVWRFLYIITGSFNIAGSLMIYNT